MADNNKENNNNTFRGSYRDYQNRYKEFLREQIKEYEESNKRILKYFAEKELKKQEDKRPTYETKFKSSIVDTVTKVADTAIGVVKAGFNVYFSYQKSVLKEAKNTMAKNNAEFNANMAMSQKALNNMVEGVSALVTNTATSAVQTITKGAYDEAKERFNLMKNLTMAQKEYQIAEEERVVELHKDIASNTKSAIDGVLGMFGGVIASVIGLITNVAKVADDIYIQFQEFDIEVLKQQKEFYGMFMERITPTLDKVRALVEMQDNVANQIVSYMKNADSVYSKQMAMYGYGREEYGQYMRKLTSDMTKIFDIKPEDIATLHTGYTNASGRTSLFSGDEMLEMEAIARAFGVSSSEVSGMIGEMDVFNTSIEDTYGMMDKVYHSLTKMGISTTKFSKQLLENLKLAQKYNFKGGVDNMAELTKWAEKVRFNLSNVSGLVNKMMSNNISDVISTAGKLQVLGGSASMFADPIAMMWEAGNDVGALAKRQLALFDDITGTLNRKTGETTFTETEMRLARAIGDATGVNYEDILNQKRLIGRQRAIEGRLRRAGITLDEESLIGISNRARYDKDSGKFMVQTIDGGKMSVEDLAKLSSEQRAELLLPENQQEAILDIAKNVRSLAERENANQAHNMITLGSEGWGGIEDYVKKSIDIQNRMFDTFKNEGVLGISLGRQIEISDKQVDAFIRGISDPKVKKATEDYQNFVKQEIGKTTLFQAQELAILSVLAEKNGVDTVNNLISLLSEVTAKDLTKEQIEKIIEEKAKVLGPNGVEYLKTIGGSLGEETEDSVGLMNGGLISGATHVTPINDGIVKTHIADEYIAAKPDGPIDKLFNGIIGKIDKMSANKDVSGGELSLKINGQLDLKQGNSNINLVDVMRTDPIQAREFSKIILKSIDIANYGKNSSFKN